MSRDGELLALRKDVLVARSCLLRLKAANELQSLRESLTCREIAGSITGSARVRSALFGTLLLVAGGGRLGRFLRVAAIGVAVARVAALVAKLARQAEPAGAGHPDSPETTS